MGAAAYDQYVAGGEFLSFCEYMRRGCILCFFLSLKTSLIALVRPPLSDTLFTFDAFAALT